MLQRGTSALLFFAGWTAAAAWGQTNTGTLARTLNFPPFGLGNTETARVNLTNVATATAAGTAASCTGTVSFIGANGSTIGTATSFTIPSGQTSSISLPFSSAGISGTRAELRAVLQVTRSTTTPAPCSLLTSLETFDTSSGASHLFLSDSADFPVASGHR